MAEMRAGETTEQITINVVTRKKREGKEMNGQ